MWSGCEMTEVSITVGMARDPTSKSAKRWKQHSRRPKIRTPYTFDALPRSTHLQQRPRCGQVNQVAPC